MQRFRFLTPVFIFISSYLPLALMLVVRNYDDAQFQSLLSVSQIVSNWMTFSPDVIFAMHFVLPVKNPCASTIVLAAPLFSFCLLILILRDIECSVGLEIKKFSATILPADIANYSIPYIAAFFSLDIGSNVELINLGIFLTTMFVISWRSGAIFFNPMMLVLGYSYMHAQYEDNDNIVSRNVLSKHPVNTGGQRCAVNVSGVLFITLKEKG